MRQARQAWRHHPFLLDLDRLVFIDETWTPTNMTRGYGRAPRGQRCRGAVPHGHWQTTTFVGALRRRELVAPRVADGPMDGEIFPAYVDQCLVPVLRAGDIVILDNLSSHKVRGIREAIAAAGARLLNCRPIPLTSTRSRSSLPSSRRGYARRRPAASMTCGTKSAPCSRPSLSSNARTAWRRVDTYTLKSKVL